MMDIESHTIMYLRDLVNTHAANDSDISSFLACWLYEETYHGRAIEQFLKSAGVPVGSDRKREIKEERKIKQIIETATTFVISNLSRHFVAAHMTWGAIQELTTLSGYTCLASKTRHPILATILRRIVLDESRHFAFYYHQAAKRLKAPGAQRLTTFLLKRFWTPVSAAVKPADDVSFIMSFLFPGSEGEQAAKRVDRTIGRLPGLGWFDLLDKSRARCLSEITRSFLNPSNPSLMPG